MSVEARGKTHRWTWTEILRDQTQIGWEHTGVCCLPDGSVVTGRPEGGALTLYNALGSLVATIPVPLTETHGICAAPAAGSSAV